MTGRKDSVLAREAAAFLLWQRAALVRVPAVKRARSSTRESPRCKSSPVLRRSARRSRISRPTQDRFAAREIEREEPLWRTS